MALGQAGLHAAGAGARDSALVSSLRAAPGVERMSFRGTRRLIVKWLLKGSKLFFRVTGMAGGGRLLPRNHFAVGGRVEHEGAG